MTRPAADTAATEDDVRIQAAVRLMRLALPLLDRAGCHGATLHLQRAIDDGVGGRTPSMSEEEMSRYLDDLGAMSQASA